MASKKQLEEHYSFVPQAGEYYWDNDEQCSREIINCYRVSFCAGFCFEVLTVSLETGKEEELETWWISEVDADNIDVTHGHRWEK